MKISIWVSLLQELDFIWFLLTPFKQIKKKWRPLSLSLSAMNLVQEMHHSPLQSWVGEQENRKTLPMIDKESIMKQNESKERFFILPVLMEYCFQSLCCHLDSKLYNWKHGDNLSHWIKQHPCPNIYPKWYWKRPRLVECYNKQWTDNGHWFLYRYHTRQSQIIFNAATM